MNIQHFEKNFHYTDQQLLYVAQKVGKLARFCNRVKDEGSFIRVDVERRSTKKERDQIKVSVQVNLPHKTMRAESRRYDVVEGIDRCIEKLEAPMKKYKDLHTNAGRSRKTRKRAA